jgi:hypothetical protein
MWVIQNRLTPLFDILKTMVFEWDFSFFILAEEPTFSLNTYVSEEDSDNVALSNILHKINIFACCSSNYIPWTKQLTLIPDFYTMFSTETIQVTPFKEKRNKVFFSGQISGWPFPLTEECPRIHLIEYSKTHDFVQYNITSAQFLESVHSEQSLIEKYKGKFILSPKCNYTEHGKYKYLLSLDGFGAAWGRIVSILFTGSVLLMHSDCNQWFDSWLRPFAIHSSQHIQDENCIFIRKDLSDLEDIFLYLESNPDVAEAIGINGKALADRLLTHEKNREFWREAIVRNGNFPGNF